MGGALLGTGTPTVYPGQQIPWGGPWSGQSTFQGMQPLTQQWGGAAGFAGQSGAYLPQQVQALQAAVQQLLQIEYIQQQHINQLLQIVPQQLHQIQQLVQHVAQQASQTSPMHSPQPFFPGTGFGMGTPPQGQLFGGQSGFGGQGGYVM